MTITISTTISTTITIITTTIIIIIMEAPVAAPEEPLRGLLPTRILIKSTGILTKSKDLV